MGTLRICCVWGKTVPTLSLGEERTKGNPDVTPWALALGLSKVGVWERKEYRMLNESSHDYQREEKGFPLRNVN